MISLLSQTELLNVTLRWDEDDFQPVGRLGYFDRVAQFEYTGDFRASRIEISPIRHRSSVDSLTVRPFDIGLFEGLHGVFHDSLPDSWGRLLVDRRARELGIDPVLLTPLDRLAWVGDRGIGALCYEPVMDVWDADNSVIALKSLETESHEVLEGKASDVIAELGYLGGSPGGARPKALVAIGDDDSSVYGPTEINTNLQQCLVKFRATYDPIDAANIEKAYAEMAQAAGVRVANSRLITDDSGRYYFLSRRFDRDGSKRLHTHTASGLLYADHRLPSLDYRDLISLTRAITHDRREVLAMYILAVFNVLAHNRDDHARQFTFAMSKDGEWKLAPAYDLTFSPGPGGEHSTSVMGKGKQIEHSQLQELGRTADLADTEAKNVIDRVTEAVVNWDQFARDWDVGRTSRTEIGKVLASG